MKKIALHSVPRSGSTWLGSILDSSSNIAYRYQPLFSYSHKGFLNANSNQKKIFNFFDDIYKTNDEFVLQKQSKTKGLVLDFNKEEITHIVYKEVRYHHILINLLNKSFDNSFIERLNEITHSEIKIFNVYDDSFKDENLFYDNGHLNKKGAKQYTQLLANYLKSDD